MCALRVNVSEVSRERRRVELSGAIDESADLGDVFRAIDGDALFDLSGIERINSIGVLRWVSAFVPHTETHEVIIEAVSYPMMLQANCVANLFGSASVRSCLAPYFCPTCKDHQMVLVTVDQLAAAEGSAPAVSCQRCRTLLDFDELDVYFQFFRSSL